MMLSKKTKHALKAVLVLAREYGKGPVLLSDLSKKERIPMRFLEAILRELRASGILRSKRGKGGGFSLCSPPEAITVGQIIRVLDGTLAPVPCVSVTAYRPCDDCDDESACAIHILMKEVRDTTALILDNMTLADMLLLPERRAVGSAV
jgi:Rrf2 family protein